LTVICLTSCRTPMQAGFSQACPEQQSMTDDAQNGIDPNQPLPQAAYAQWSPPGISQPWPDDEYVRDGGDKGVPTAVGDESKVNGLEYEDTIAHYETMDGKTVVEPSNEVHIYSPRFSAVRQVVGLAASEQKQKLYDVNGNLALAAPKLSQKVNSAKQQVQIDNAISARPLQAFRMKQGDGALSNVIGPRGFQNSYKPYENLAINRIGIFDNKDKLLFARSAQSAVSWSQTEKLQVILDLRSAMAAVQNEQATTIFSADVPPGKPKLRVVKTASTPDAAPGEEVWFTIRFDNVGNQSVGHVAIIDSLSPRLEYVENSAQCSRKADFTTQPNEVESLVIRCELSEPLEPGRGGLIRFCCKVR
jgi:uncharacterized repeat protein (TIGR01451 family)